MMGAPCRPGLAKCMAQFMNGRLKFEDMSRIERISCTKVRGGWWLKRHQKGSLLFKMTDNHTYKRQKRCGYVPQVLWPLVRFPLRWTISRPSFSRTFFSCQDFFQTLCTLLFCVKFQPFSPKAAHFGIEKHPKLQFSAQWNDRNLLSRICPS